MKATVYKLENGKFSLLLQAAPGKGRPPLLVQDVELKDVRATVLPLIQQVRRPREAPAGPAGA